MRGLSFRPFCSCDGRQAGLLYIAAGCGYTTPYAGAELRAKRPAFWPSAPVPGEVRSRVATDQYRCQSLLDELTRPLDQVADNRGRGHDLVHQPNALARQEIHGLDI